jgi:DNA-binding MarR family transcriptional regulator
MPSPGYFEQHSTPIEQRLATGLYKLGLAVKHQERQQSLEEGLSSTQAQILTVLATEGDKTPSEVASHLGLSLPSVSDSVTALVSKKFVSRHRAPSHHRATLLRLTRTGSAVARRASDWPEFLVAGIHTLTDAQRESLLSILLSMLRSLQEAGRIPVQRMCVTCTFFRPNVHTGARPHHCQLVDAPMGAAHLRLVCDEHETASVAAQVAQWHAFISPAV